MKTTFISRANVNEWYVAEEELKTQLDKSIKESLKFDDPISISEKWEYTLTVGENSYKWNINETHELDITNNIDAHLSAGDSEIDFTIKPGYTYVISNVKYLYGSIFEFMVSQFKQI